MVIRWQAILEVWLIAAAVLYVYRLIKGTRGANVLSGLVIALVFFMIISSIFHLTAIIILVQALSAFLVMGLIIIFQPELRQVLAELGRASFFGRDTRQSFVIENVVQALESLKERCFGALIAFEMSVPNSQVLESGVPLKAVVSEELLCTIFTDKTPLHDGGVLIVEDRIYAAGCIFPITQRQNLSRMLGLRHRAALGLSEESDAVVVVLSEETGEISLCRKGEIERSLDIDQLRLRLSEILLPQGNSRFQFLDKTWQKVRGLLRLRFPSMRKYQFMPIMEVIISAVIAVLIWFLLMQGVEQGGVKPFWPF